MKKLPFINNKKLFLAVMGACSWINKTGWFNKACKYYADKYSVDEEDVKKYVRIAQQNGRKVSSKTKNAKFKYYAIHGHLASDRGIVNCYEFDFGKWKIVKATNQINAVKQLSKNDDLSEYGSWFVYGEIREFNTLNEAQNFLKVGVK